MTFTISLGGESKVADATLEWSLAVVGTKVTYESALVCAGVITQITFVRGQSEVGTCVTYVTKHRQRISHL